MKQEENRIKNSFADLQAPPFLTVHIELDITGAIPVSVISSQATYS